MENNNVKGICNYCGSEIEISDIICDKCLRDKEQETKYEEYLEKTSEKYD